MSKRTRISMLEVEAVPKVVFRKSRLVWVELVELVESFDLRPSIQYILVRLIPSCFRFLKMFLRQASLLTRCSSRSLTSSSWKSCTLDIWTGGGGARFSSCGECDVELLGSVSYHSTYLTSFWLQVGWFAVCVKQCLDHCPWLLLQYRRQRLLW
jgi:hypothetical protein